MTSATMFLPDCAPDRAATSREAVLLPLPGPFIPLFHLAAPFVFGRTEHRRDGETQHGNFTHKLGKGFANV